VKCCWWNYASLQYKTNTSTSPRNSYTFMFNKWTINIKYDICSLSLSFLFVFYSSSSNSRTNGSASSMMYHLNSKWVITSVVMKWCSLPLGQRSITIRFNWVHWLTFVFYFSLKFSCLIFFKIVWIIRRHPALRAFLLHFVIKNQNIIFS
jgi:hypothetical protein